MILMSDFSVCHKVKPQHLIKIKPQNTYVLRLLFAVLNRIWRRGRDSNPRAVSSKLISSQPRYDRFDTSAYKVVFEFCTAFARPMVKCVHSKFKKNEAFGRYCEKTRAFASCRVISSATFRVSPVMSC